ncbi:hypothetical protein [Nocardia australiensis]|uniref:hypothetical protein n=1 Tax=Nocardia australiensis TaxID=2887191 RepID=UPI001D15D7F4|nr:hypothetical protein [Nocardia australiensis]
MIVDFAQELLAVRVENPTPEAPPSAEQIMKITRYFTWFMMLSGVLGITYSGGMFAWEKWNNRALASPKMLAGAMIGGVVTTSAGAIMNSLIG